MIYVYWTLAAPTGFIAALVITLTLSGKALSSATPDWLALLAAAAVLALLAWSYHLATSAGRTGLAILVVIVSWVVFAGTMLIYGLMHQHLWN